MNVQEGIFEQAKGGTAFLDEIGDMPFDVQAKLLTFLDTGSFKRLGGKKAIQSDVRIIAATNKDLLKEEKEGRFRGDLRFRLDVLELYLPPLAKRIEDIPYLTKYLLLKNGDVHELEISLSALRKLAAHSWPGNLRELENVLKRALALSRNNRLDSDDISFGKDKALSETRKPNRTEKPKPTDDELRENFQTYVVRDGRTRKELAESLGMDESTLKHRLKKAGCPPGKPGPRPRRT